MCAHSSSRVKAAKADQIALERRLQQQQAQRDLEKAQADLSAEIGATNAQTAADVMALSSVVGEGLPKQSSAPAAVGTQGAAEQPGTGAAAAATSSSVEGQDGASGIHDADRSNAQSGPTATALPDEQPSPAQPHESAASQTASAAAAAGPAAIDLEEIRLEELAISAAMPPNPFDPSTAAAESHAAQPPEAQKEALQRSSSLPSPSTTTLTVSATHNDPPALDKALMDGSTTMAGGEPSPASDAADAAASTAAAATTSGPSRVHHSNSSGASFHTDNMLYGLSMRAVPGRVILFF